MCDSTDLRPSTVVEQVGDFKFAHRIANGKISPRLIEQLLWLGFSVKLQLIIILTEKEWSTINYKLVHAISAKQSDTSHYPYDNLGMINSQAVRASAHTLFVVWTLSIMFCRLLCLSASQVKLVSCQRGQHLRGCSSPGMSSNPVYLYLEDMLLSVKHRSPLVYNYDI